VEIEKMSDFDKITNRDAVRDLMLICYRLYILNVDKYWEMWGDLNEKYGYIR
jgi:hypothetical protein